ncbi:MAG: hypothetical protein P1P89_00475 [Desulfobacterales bacterium]|nr:hypothetical protein [Desulfobacterales bacterium]
MNPMFRLSIFIAIFSICLFSYLLLPFLYPSTDLTGLLEVFDSPAANFIFFLAVSLTIAYLLTKIFNAVFGLFHYRKTHEPKIGEILMSLDLVSRDDLVKALRLQKMKLGEILVEFGRISPEQRDFAVMLQKTQKNRRIGEILKELGYSTEEDIRWGLNRAHRKLGKTLSKLKLVDNYDINWAMSLKDSYFIDSDGRIVEKIPEPIIPRPKITKK